MNFSTECAHIQNISSELLSKLDADFEERLSILEVHFPLEDLLSRRESGARSDGYLYCVFADGRGLHFTRLNRQEAEVARKFKAQVPLTREEKEIALWILMRL